MSSSAQKKVQSARGSVWRKWDLQVHTPYSVLNNQFGSDFPAYAKQLITRACDDDVAVACVGVTDYFTVKGYKELQALLADKGALQTLVGDELAEKVSKILFVPNVELRLKTLIVDRKTGEASRVNLHVIFSNEVSAEEIEEHFLHELKFTAQGNPDSQDERWTLNERNLTNLGNRLRLEHAQFAEKSDLFVGMMTAVVDDGDISKILQSQQSVFKDRYLICLPCDEDLSKCSWNSQAHLVRKVLIQKAHFLFSSNAKTRSFGLGQFHPTPNHFVSEFRSFKPCIHSSDSHSNQELFVPKEDNFTWIKADPTFQGLRQILHEPGDRVIIGREHPRYTENARRATRIIKSITIKRLPSATTEEKWFDCNLKLNPELIAVIGNKGSGKSALSDIIALLGNTRRGTLSFLNDDKFRHVRRGMAKQFYAELTWLDKTPERVASLDDKPRPEAVEKIQYIPQNYLESICTALDSGKGSPFYQELEAVIFSHVKEAEKLGFETLAELLDHRSKEASAAIAQLVQELREINADIITLEDHASPHNRSALNEQLIEKQRELKSHHQNRPAEVPKPEEDPSAQQQSKEAEQQLEIRKGDLVLLEAEIKRLTAADAVSAKREDLAERLSGKLNNLKHQLEAFFAENKQDFQQLGIELSQIVSIEIKPALLLELLGITLDERKSIANQLDPAHPDSVESKRISAVTSISVLQSKLGEAQKKYQAYLESVKAWKNIGAGLIGTSATVGSIANLQAQLSALDETPKKLRALRKARDWKFIEIFREKQKMRSYFERYYGDVQDFLQHHELAKGSRFQVEFDVSTVEKGFMDRFFDQMVDGRKSGPFRKNDDGGLLLKRLLEGTDFSREVDAFRFVKRLLRKMSDNARDYLGLRSQLRSGCPIQDFYDYVFSLDYLSLIYNLQWEGKHLEQLSPGERGSLLLIFYLIVDLNDIPLVIDQPEENLDNQTVFQILVPCIKYAKKHRQIVMVTHNPNLAVVCDAEQIICAEMRKDQGNEINYVTGSIEDAEINRRIVDILEGTRPAFDKRDDKYIPLRA